MQAAVPALTGRPEPAVVIISSAIGRHPTPGMGVYGATKAALHYLVPTWAAELAPRGIRVNAVCAGITDTPGLKEGAKHVPGLEAMVVATNLVKRIAAPDEIARPVVSLLDTASTGYVNGAVWDVDGGYLRDLSGGSHDAA
jgi:NAD(P)-dependent dehydrogenase (short-subunit alcohol dehydrogenase family)